MCSWSRSYRRSRERKETTIDDFPMTHRNKFSLLFCVENRKTARARCHAVWGEERFSRCSRLLATRRFQLIQLSNFETDWVCACILKLDQENWILILAPPRSLQSQCLSLSTALYLHFTTESCAVQGLCDLRREGFRFKLIVESGCGLHRTSSPPPSKKQSEELTMSKPLALKLVAGASVCFVSRWWCTVLINTVCSSVDFDEVSRIGCPR